MTLIPKRERGPELAAVLRRPAAEPATVKPAKPKRPRAEPKPKGYLKDEPVNPPALGECVTRMEVDALRSDERELLRFIRNRGPMTLRLLTRQYPASKKEA